MNKLLVEYARRELKKMISQLTEIERHLFKHIYARTSNITSINISSIEEIINGMDANKLDDALGLLQHTIKIKEEKNEQGTI